MKRVKGKKMGGKEGAREKVEMERRKEGESEEGK